MFVVCVVCYQVEVSATDWSLVQRSPTNCGASLCVIRKPRKRGGWSALLGCGKYNRNLSDRWACGFESHRKHDFLSLVSVVCCRVEVSAMSWSLIQRSPTGCGASLDLETSWTRRTWTTGGCCAKIKKRKDDTCK
jgi:hypothetical protein